MARSGDSFTLVCIFGVFPAGFSFEWLSKVGRLSARVWRGALPLLAGGAISNLSPDWIHTIVTRICAIHNLNGPDNDALKATKWTTSHRLQKGQNFARISR